jgi:rhomboid protease GluP
MIGFPPKYKSVYQSGLGPHGIHRIIAEAFEQLKWKYYLTGQGIFRAKVTMSGSSWGETVTAEISGDNVVLIESRCSLQMIDWGKNKANVTRFINELQNNEKRYQSLGPGSADQGFEIDGSSRVEKLFAEDEK